MNNTLPGEVGEIFLNFKFYIYFLLEAWGGYRVKGSCGRTGNEWGWVHGMRFPSNEFKKEYVTKERKYIFYIFTSFHLK